MEGETTVGQFCPFVYGKGLPERSRNIDGNVPVYGSNGIVGWHDTPLTNGPTVIVGRKGTVGAVHLSLNPCWPIDTAFYIEFSNEWEARYTYYLLNTLGLEHMNSDSAVPGLNRDAVHYRSVSIPDEAKRAAIACILGALDDKIELNRRMNRTLEAMARALFESWFVDFDPVRAKVAGQAPAGLKPEIAALFPDRLVVSELGEIPEGWRVQTLPSVMDINPKRLLSRGMAAPYLDMSNMPTQGPSPGAWAMREVGSGMKFVNGDTLVARITPCLENGKTAFVDFLADGQTGWGSTEYIVLRPKGIVPPVFAYILARTESFRSFAIHQMTGSSGRQRVPAASLTNYSIVLPEIDSPIFAQFDESVTPMFERIKTTMMQSRTLAALRDTLLPQLISGALRVADAERIVGRCL